MLERWARLQADTLNEISQASATQQRTEHKRLALERLLQNNDETQHKELNDEQTKQARLRNHLATADLRLSVTLAATETTGSCAIPTTAESGRVIHRTRRSQLEPAHAQQIVGITDTGD